MATERASVTEIHLCHRCPRLLAYRRIGQRGAWRVGLKGDGSFPGTIFHNRIARRFHQELAGGKPTPLVKAVAGLLTRRPADFDERLQAILKEHVLDPVLADIGRSLSSDQVMALASGVIHWSRYLSGFLSKRHFRDPRRIQARLPELFAQPEQRMRSAFRIDEETAIEVSGAFDTLLIDRSANEAVVVELKGYRPSHEDEDFIQVALYGWLIRRETGVTPRCVVLYLEDPDPVADYPARRFDGIEPHLSGLFRTVREVLQGTARRGGVRLPLPQDRALCGVCPFDRQCDAHWGPRREKSPEAGPDRPPEANTDAEAADAAMKRVVSTLSSLKLPVRPEGYICGPRLIRLKVKPRIRKGATVKKIMNRAEDLQIELSLAAPPLIRAQAGYLGIDIPRPSARALTLEALWEAGAAQRPDSAVAFPLGMAVDGGVLWADLTLPTMTSILIAGTAGSGKSVCLRSALLGMAMNAVPDRVRFTLIDPKRVSFTDLGTLPHLDGPPILDIAPAMDALNRLVDEMEARYHRFARRAVVDITEFNRKETPLAHHVVFIDEYADLLIDKTLQKETETLIQRLCQKGRAAGFHLLLSTQRPDSKVITPLIKANLQLKIALKVTTASNSQVVLDEPGAEMLMGNGDMLVGGAIPVTRLQGPIPTTTRIETVRPPR